MKLSLALLPTLACAGTIGAQITIVSPPQAVNVEGNSSSGVTFTNATTRTQQVDSNLIGSKLVVIRSMAFRRTNIHSRVGATARKCDVTIDMGYAAATHTNNFDNNFKSGSRTNVFTKKSVNLPDWTGATTRPAPFDLVFKLDKPFANNRKEAVVWDLIVENNAGGGSYYMDWFSRVPATTSGTKPVALGKGCTTKNGTFTHTTAFTADATNMKLEFAGTSGPSTAACVINMGAKDLNAPTPFCTKLHGDLTFVFPLGATDANGAVKQAITFPWDPALAGLELVSQLAAFDATQPGIPWALTNGVKGTTPFAKGGGATTEFKINRCWSNSGKGPTGNRSTTCAPVKFSI